MSLRDHVGGRLFLSVLLAFFFLAFFSSLAPADQGELADIVNAIKSSKARWSAGETSISKLPPQARMRRLGALKPMVTDEELAAAGKFFPPPTGTLPGSLDWRSYPGGTSNSASYVTPVKDQGNCGDCWAFATTAGLESQYLIAQQTPGQDINLSEQTLVSCSGAGSCSGGYIDTASDYLSQVGLPLETCFAYTATNNNCGIACLNWQSSTYGINGWHYIATSSPTVDAIKNALTVYGPLVTTMSVYSDFFYYQSGVYTYTHGTYQGGHAILIVGYDDSQSCFIVKNSWGTGWGEAGFFQIGYSELTGKTKFGDYTIAYEGYEHLPPPCTYALSPTSKTFPASGGNGSVSVSSPYSCSWNATSDVTWITLKSGVSGSGSGKVSYAVAANTTTAQRTGTLTIAGQAFIVTQSGRTKTK